MSAPAANLDLSALLQFGLSRAEHARLERAVAEARISPPSTLPEAQAYATQVAETAHDVRERLAEAQARVAAAETAGADALRLESLRGVADDLNRRARETGFQAAMLKLHLRRLALAAATTAMTEPESVERLDAAGVAAEYEQRAAVARKLEETLEVLGAAMRQTQYAAGRPDYAQETQQDAIQALHQAIGRRLDALYDRHRSLAGLTPRSELQAGADRRAAEFARRLAGGEPGPVLAEYCHDTEQATYQTLLDQRRARTQLEGTTSGRATDGRALLTMRAATEAEDLAAREMREIAAHRDRFMEQYQRQVRTTARLERAAALEDDLRRDRAAHAERYVADRFGPTPEPQPAPGLRARLASRFGRPRAADPVTVATAPAAPTPAPARTR